MSLAVRAEGTVFFLKLEHLPAAHCTQSALPVVFAARLKKPGGQCKPVPPPRFDCAAPAFWPAAQQLGCVNGRREAAWRRLRKKVVQIGVCDRGRSADWRAPKQRFEQSAAPLDGRPSVRHWALLVNFEHGSHLR